MKKIFLLVLCMSLVVTKAHADIISVPAFSADSSVAHLEQFRTTLVNVVNGQISGSAGTGSTKNILANSVAEPEMYDDANPRVRDSELLGNTVDTYSSGTLNQRTYIYSGGVPATSASLTSNISACVAYINGYRISKGATSHTYSASKDTYVDLSESGVYTFSEVALGATQPVVAANSARLAKVITDGTTITTSTDLANRRLIGVLVPSNFRSGFYISRDSTTTIKVFPGTAEVNSTMVSSTSPTTLTISTAGDWAGGTSLRATSTYGYVGLDASGNIKMHTTAPTHDNYGVSSTVGKKRYSTWSSTVYRILGWFYMNATGSGELNTYEVGNIKEGDVANSTILTSSTSVNSNSATFVADTQAVSHFYSSGGPINIIYDVALGNSGANRSFIQISVDTVGIAALERESPNPATGTAGKQQCQLNYQNTLGQSGHTIQGYYRDVNGGATSYVNHRNVITRED